jgi:hypothetical protein
MKDNMAQTAKDRGKSHLPVFIKKGEETLLLTRGHRQFIGFETCVAQKL